MSTNKPDDSRENSTDPGQQIVEAVDDMMQGNAPPAVTPPVEKVAEPRSAWDWFLLCLSTGLFLGFVKPRTATLATTLGIPLTWLLVAGADATFGVGFYWLAIFLLCAVGVPICQAGEDLLAKEDPREVTWDEIATLPIVYAGAPNFYSWKIILIGFGLHRFFDILKPLGIRRLQKFHGGWGIMIDDVAAAFCALIVMHVFYYMHWL